MGFTQFLNEILHSLGCIELLEKITPLIISVFAEQVRYHMQPAKELVFPRLLGKRLADSFLHAAIRRGDKEMVRLFQFHRFLVDFIENWPDWPLEQQILGMDSPFSGKLK